MTIQSHQASFRCRKTHTLTHSSVLFAIIAMSSNRFSLCYRLISAIVKEITADKQKGDVWRIWKLLRQPLFAASDQFLIMQQLIYHCLYVVNPLYCHGIVIPTICAMLVDDCHLVYNRINGGLVTVGNSHKLETQLLKYRKFNASEIPLLLITYISEMTLLKMDAA